MQIQWPFHQSLKYSQTILIHKLQHEQVPTDNCNINYILKTTDLGIAGISESKADLLSKAVRKALSLPPSHSLLCQQQRFISILSLKSVFFLTFQIWVSFSLFISNQIILFCHPVVRLRKSVLWEVLHLCVRILTPGFLVVVKNSST